MNNCRRSRYVDRAVSSTVPPRSNPLVITLSFLEVIVDNTTVLVIYCLCLYNGNRVTNIFYIELGLILLTHTVVLIVSSLKLNKKLNKLYTIDEEHYNLF